ncbi:hypothetical protein DSOL_2529 [Desulfosporosinus metallidurans]|uniref:Uncharacterized protein n=1 Tax=Desulfosporosinus metallidurans TaxID=1888891 RepID=A0A1Q8QVY1_9FIRM|nr:hypothetical protein DSOL_2529 [Desulfosporosinus metallidurans]
MAPSSMTFSCMIGITLDRTDRDGMVFAIPASLARTQNVVSY